MAKYIIEGGVRLRGEVKISGNKNSVLPCLAACLLTEDEVTLTNCPQIADVRVFLEILKELGVSRVVFGSDLPYSHPAVERTKLDLLLSPSEREKVYSKNPKKILGG